MGVCKKPTIEGTERIVVAIGVFAVLGGVYVVVTIIYVCKSKPKKQPEVPMDDLDEHDKAS